MAPDAPTILGVFAHPDDESIACGGLVARAAALGARVVVVSLTRGEAGPGESAGAAALGAARATEMSAAARVLGAEAAVVLDHADGMLPWLDHAVLERDIRQLVETHAADVVVTFDRDGLYWHPDHIAVHERVTAVVTALGPAAPALFYVSMAPGQMRAVAARAGGADVVPGLHDPDAFGAGAPPPTLVIDAGPLAARKLAAIRCHASQFATSAFAALTADDAPLIAREHYRRAEAGAAGLTLLDRIGTPPARVSL
jgi:LmbE family N-acetylglucosaminyl deacetylase